MLLKVQCEKCKTKYKLEESRVQGKGAKITCPKCRHVFVVMKDALNVSEGSDDSGELQDGASENVATGTVAPVAFAQPGAAKALEAPAPASPVAAGPAADPELAVTRPTSAESLNWKEVGLTTFKVKVAIGLVYDFSDIGTLRKYIAEKRVAPTDRLSFDGKTWTVIKDAPDLDAFFIDQWVALKVERLKEEKSGKRSTSPGTTGTAGPSGPTGPVFGDSKRGGEKKSTARMPGVNVPAPGGDAAGDSAARKSAWSADAGGEGAGLFGQDLFDDMNGAEEAAGMAQALARGNAAAPKNQTSRRTAVPVPEPRPSAAASTVAREPVRLPAPMPVAAPRSFKLEELALLGFLACVVGYLGWKFMDEAGAAEVVPPPDKAAQTAEVDQFMRNHFPLTFTGGAEASGAAGAVPTGAGGSGGKDAGAGKPSGPEAVANVGKDPDAQALATQNGGKEPVKPSADDKKADDKKADDKKADDKKNARPEAGAKSGVEVGAITADDLFQLGQESLRNKDYAGAVQSLKAAAGMKPGNANFQYTLGYALLQAGQDQEAEQAFKKAAGGSKKEAFKWLGEIYARRGQKDQAKDAWQKYLKTNPRDAQAIQKKIEQL